MNAPHALITGGSSGIGLAVAAALAAEGWNLALVARDADKLARARDRLGGGEAASRGRVLTFAADVASADDNRAAVEAAVAALGAPGLVVTSAGVARPGRFAEIPADAFRQAIEVNYLGTLYTVMAAAPAMRARRAGRIVMVSSGAGLIGIFGYTAYAPSKFAVRGLAESLRGELAPDGVGVSVVYPPDTETPQLAEENRYKPAATKRITAAARAWSADAVARVILDGVRAGRFAITPGWEMTLLYRLHSVIGPLLQRRFDRLAATADAAPRPSPSPSRPGRG